MSAAFLVEALTSFLIVVGGAFALLGSIGLARLPDFLTRLHGPTKATTLGVGALLVGSMIHLNTLGHGFSLRELAITLFLFITAPVSAHMLAKVAMRKKMKGIDNKSS
jgi:multicomponent K+:H+ antiporter subunit G